MKNSLKKIFIIFSFLLVFFSTQSIVYGQTSLLPEASGDSCEEGDATYCGNYVMNDFIKLAINISQIILGLIGSLSLLAFVAGGVMFMISGGSSNNVEKAKKIITAAVVGLVIVFASWMIIRFVILSLGSNPEINSLEVDIKKIPTPATQENTSN